MDMNNNNKIYMVTLSDYSEYVEGKHRNGGAYGYDCIYTYNRDTDSFTYEWTTTNELMPDDEPSGSYSLTQVLTDVADFISRNADSKNCIVYINGVRVWESTPQENIDIDMSDYFLED